jgi:protein tyrosine/serine phosphatase
MAHPCSVAILAIALTTPASVYNGVEPAAPAEQTSTTQSTRHNLPDFGQITPTLYRGAQPNKEGFRMLAKMGINIVVDLRGDRESERKLVNSLGMQYVSIYWFCWFPKDEVFAQFLTLLRDNPGKKVFVHCRVGDDRTGMMIAVYRMADERWSAQRAEKEMEKFGFNFAHRRMICPSLLHYEREFPERFKTSPAFRKLR